MQLGTQLKGLLLALTTALFWGTLPIALKQVVTTVDPMTIVWLRFSTGALWLWVWLPRRDARRLRFGVYERRIILLLGIAPPGWAAISCCSTPPWPI